MKYADLKLGTVEAIVNKLGGMEGVERFLRGELVVSESAWREEHNVYSVAVDYSLSLVDMIKAGRYDWVNDDIVANHFPVSGNGKTEIEMHLVHFNRTIESEKAIAELDNMGLRPASIEELLALGAQCPDFQREFPIVALGSVWRHAGGDPHVPFLWSSSDERRLGLGWFDDSWSDDCRFAAVRK